MKITKYVHSCLLVEMPAPINRTALFDPGIMSESALDVSGLEFLDDIIITHEHGDHLSLALIKQLVAKFPDVRITSTTHVTQLLSEHGIEATDQQSDGIVLLEAPHENVDPLWPTPESLGVHFLDRLTHPGDSHNFSETKTVLALPVTAPWGSMVNAFNIAIELNPKYIVPIHDWHWREEARLQAYQDLTQAFAKVGITFLGLEDGHPVVVDV
ncbi:MAG: MBL fold metallo-hydrolase [Candidatus Saccharibacteria bacterium]